MLYLLSLQTRCFQTRQVSAGGKIKMSSHGDEHTFVRQRHADSRVFAGCRTIPQPHLSTDSCDLQVAGVGIPCFPPVPSRRGKPM